MEKRVLVIDDEASLRRTVGFGLMQRGYDAELCENGMTGLQALETHKRKNMPLDCAIVDIRLPDIDGLKLLKVIRFNYPGLPVVVITGHGNDQIAQEAKSADGYLEKPFDMDDLTKLLEEIPEAKTSEVIASEPVPAETFNAYALVSLEPTANLMDVYRKLYFAENIVYCDAVRGECDLTVLLQAETPEKVAAIIDEQIKTIPGVADVNTLNVEAPVFSDAVVDIIGSVDKALGNKSETEIYAHPSGGATSYVLLEIEKEKLHSIYPALYFNDNVVYSDYTKGKYDIVMLLKGTSFADIDNTIKTKIKPLDGVLRVKEWPIITLFDM
jgi:CheY-like chemotaxis protein